MKGKNIAIIVLIIAALSALYFFFKKKMTPVIVTPPTRRAYVEIGAIEKPPTLDAGIDWYKGIGSAVAGLFGKNKGAEHTNIRDNSYLDRYYDRGEDTQQHDREQQYVDAHS